MITGKKSAEFANFNSIEAQTTLPSLFDASTLEIFSVA